MGDSASQVHGRETHDGLGGYRAVWSPGTPAEIGAVGLLDGDVFEPGATPLVREGIPFTVETDSSQDTVGFMSSRGVEVSTKAKGEASTGIPEIPKAKAAIAFNFSKAGGIVLHLEGCVQPYIGNDSLEFVEGIIGSRFPEVVEGGVRDERSRFYRCDNRFVGGRGNDVLVGGWGTDALLVGEGDDGIYPGSSFPGTGQVASGGAGDDTVSYGPNLGDRYHGPNLGDRYPSFDPVYDLRLSLPAGTATGSSLADELVGIENASGGFEDDVIVGSRATNVLRGYDGNDRVYGRAGNDQLFGEKGDDSLDGGGGRDACGEGSGGGVAVRCELEWDRMEKRF